SIPPLEQILRQNIATLAVLIGHTPFQYTVPSSHTPRRFVMHRKGFVDNVFEIVPDREKIEYPVNLEKGGATAPAAVHPATVPAQRPPAAPVLTAEPPVLKPEPPAARPEPPVIKPDPIPPAQRDPDAIMLKPDPSRSGTGSGTP
ncbi:MAG TPA: hypothetical protein VF469_32480, partial [Kofleriaceae bacterium]